MSLLISLRVGSPGALLGLNKTLPSLLDLRFSLARCILLEVAPRPDSAAVLAIFL